MKKVINTISILCFLLTLPVKAGENLGTRSELATVGGIIISSSDFIQTHSALLSKYGLSDSKKLRSETLDGLIRDKILYTYALESKYESSEEAVQELERIKIQALLNAFVKTELAPQVIVSDSNLVELYRRLHTKLNVRHIYSRTKTDIDSLYALLLNGADFEILASNCFTNTSLQDNGGHLGYISYDELHPSLESAAYMLKPSEFSEPVKTSTGYSIVRVEEILSNPLLTEYDFVKKKKDLISFAKKKKQEIYFQSYINGIVNELNITYEVKVLEKLWTNYNKGDYKLDPESGIINSEPGLDKILLTSNNDSWTVAEFYQKSRYTSSGQKKLIKDPEGFKEFINGLAARDVILKRAGSSGLSETEMYHEEVKLFFENYLIERVEEEILHSINISVEEALQYYLQNGHLYTVPGKIKLYGILIDDKKTHDQVLEKLSEGVPFSTLAQLYSIQRQTAVNGGELGYFTLDELGWIGDELFELKPGQYKGGLVMDGKFLIAMCTDKTPISVTGFDDVKTEIISDLKSYALKSEIQEFTSKRKKQLKIEIDEELIESLIISRSK